MAETSALVRYAAPSQTRSWRKAFRHHMIFWDSANDSSRNKRIVGLERKIKSGEVTCTFYWDTEVCAPLFFSPRIGKVQS